MLNCSMCIQENIVIFFNSLIIYKKLLNICKRDKNFLLDFGPQDSNVGFRPDNVVVEVHLSLH